MTTRRPLESTRRPTDVEDEVVVNEHLPRMLSVLRIDGPIYFEDMFTRAFPNTRRVEGNCSLWLAPSILQGVGRGVFAGRSFAKGEVVEVSRIVTCPHSFVQDTILHNYVWDGAVSSSSDLLIGVGCAFNHDLTNISAYYTTSADSRDRLESVFKADRDITAGEEIFISYGDSGKIMNSWLKNRGIAIQESPPSSRRTDSLGSVPREMKHCLTDVRSAPNGNGLIAERSFAIGEIVSISAALAIDKHKVEELSRRTSRLINFTVGHPSSSLAFVLINYLLLASHSYGEEALENTKLEWHFWDESDFLSKQKHFGSRNMRRQTEAQFGNQDMRLVATKKIEKGQMIVFNKGTNFSSARKCRSMVHAPYEMWPKEWLNEEEMA